MEDVEAVCAVVCFDGSQCHEAELGFDVHVRAVDAVLGLDTDGNKPTILASIHIETLRAVLTILDVIPCTIFAVEHVYGLVHTL